jgi:hypothetical protein
LSGRWTCSLHLVRASAETSERIAATSKLRERSPREHQTPNTAVHCTKYCHVRHRESEDILILSCVFDCDIWTPTSPKVLEKEPMQQCAKHAHTFCDSAKLRHAPNLTPIDTPICHVTIQSIIQRKPASCTTCCIAVLHSVTITDSSPLAPYAAN